MTTGAVSWLLVLASCGEGPGPERDTARADPRPLGRGSFGPVSTPGGTLWAVVSPGSPSAAAAALTLADAPGPGAELERHEPIDRRGLVSLWRVPPELAPGRYTLDITTGLGDPPLRAEVDLVAPAFRRVDKALGVDFVHEVRGWSAGCAESLTGLGFADVDLDGDHDLLAGNLMAPAELWLAEVDDDGDGLPRLVRAGATGLEDLDLVASIHFADFDNDGDPDLFAGRRGVSRLYRNRFVPEGVVAFQDETEALGLSDAEQRAMGAGWGDYDGDGDLDLYVATHAWCYPSQAQGLDHRLADHLYRNDGEDGFLEVSGLLPDANGEVALRFGFAAVWVDYDRDHDQDLLVINDLVPHGGRSVLFRNEGEGGDGVAFTNATLQANVAPLPDALGKPVNAMGVDLGDVDRDGFPDVAYSNIGPNFLLLSQVEDGVVSYVDVAADARVDRTLLPWGALSITWATHLLDADADADLDLFFVGGELKRGPDPQPHAYFENLGDGTFADRTWEAGLDDPGHGKASAVVDLDRDGFLDLAVANWGGPLEIYRNQLGDRADRAHWLIVDLQGDGARVNRDGLGGIVELTLEDGTRSTCFRNPRPSLSATGDFGCHFGLGAATTVADLTVDWPDGVRQAVLVEGVDTRILVAYTRP